MSSKWFISNSSIKQEQVAVKGEEPDNLKEFLWLQHKTSKFLKIGGLKDGDKINFSDYKTKRDINVTVQRNGR